MHAAELVLFRDSTLLPRHPRTLVAGLDQGQRKAVWIPKRERALAEARLELAVRHALLLEAGYPVAQTPGRNGERNLDGQTDPRPCRRHLRPGEEGEVGARRADPVRVEEVIGVGNVLIHAPLDEAHTHDPDPEVEVLLRVTRDGRDVVNTVYGGFHGYATAPVGCGDRCFIEAATPPDTPGPIHPRTPRTTSAWCSPGYGPPGTGSSRR